MAADDTRNAELEGLFRQAFSLYEARRYDEAEKIVVGLLRAASGHAPSYGLRGAIWVARGDAERGALNFAHAVRLEPENISFRNNLAQALARSGRFEQAISCFEEAVALSPDNVSLRANYARTLRDLSRAEEAEIQIRHAIDSAPGDAGLLGTLGNILVDRGDAVAAERAYRSAVEAEPGNPAAHYNLALFLMRCGLLAEGLREYEWRWQLPGWRWRPFAPNPGVAADRLPEDLSGRTVLVWGEQGLGDEILFSGGLDALARRGAQVTLECEARLVDLMRRSWPGFRVLPALDPPVDELGNRRFDFAFPIGSLPHRLGFTGTGDLATARPHLTHDGERSMALRRKYRAGEDRLLVGISWRSGASVVANRKTAPLALWHDLLKVPGIRFVDLQYGDVSAERNAAERSTGVTLLHDPEIDSSRDLDGFAAQVAAMDHVITISNATAHFAGALGIPCDLLLSNGALWHWLSDGAKSPHYPSIRIHRQEKPGDWQAPLQAVGNGLRGFSGAL